MADNEKKDVPENIEPEVLENDTAQDISSPPPNLTADKAVPLIPESEGLADRGEDTVEIPDPADNVVPFDSIAEKQRIEPTNPAQEVPADVEQSPAKKVRGRPPKADRPQKPPEQGAPAEKTDKLKGRGRPPRSNKSPKKPELDSADPDDLPPWEKPEEKPPEKTRKPRAPKKAAPIKEEAPATPAEPEQPPVPRDATRSNGTEQIVYLNLSELHPFKDHPFGVRDDAEMKALVESVRSGGVNQPALVRPREDGGYEIVAGHRRQKASELAGYANMPCIVREMTDDEAILAMTDDNLRQRSEILPSEKAVSLKMQVEAIKHQGARGTSGQNVQNKDPGKRSIDIVGERNNMNAKQVQRYIRLTELVPDLVKAVDEKKLGFTPAVEISFIKSKNQNFIAVTLESEQSAPSLSQAQRLRQLDQKGELNSDIIDGILCEQKKEEIKVVLSGKELETYFGKDKTPQEMKEQIIKLLDEWAGKEKEHAAPEKQPER
ncbi:MAG TPA: DNA-binding protein [Firmicutes bacterium]|nr:DNA-binding protein [Bacillota bacterium]